MWGQGCVARPRPVSSTKPATSRAGPYGIGRVGGSPPDHYEPVSGACDPGVRVVQAGKSATAALTGQNHSGKVGKLPRKLDPRMRVGCGERLFLENSTGCLISQCQVFALASCVLGVGVSSAIFFDCRDGFSRFLLESLILAQ